MKLYDLINYTRYKKDKLYHVIETNSNYQQLLEIAKYMYANSGMNYAIIDRETQEVVFESGEW